MGMNRGQRRAEWRGLMRGQQGGRESPGRAAGGWSSTIVRVREIEFRGWDRVSAQRIASAFEGELRRLLQTHMLPPGWRGNADVVRVAPLRLQSLADARRIGEQLAHALFTLETQGRSGTSQR
jgi:hypothetical protein